jgi:hypothetical protein
MRQSSLFATVLILLLVVPPARGQTTRPIPAVDRMIIISIDGGRPDLILRANCPAIRSLMASGCYTFWARTTAMSITLPSHVSMLTGVTPNHHGIFWNEELALTEPVYPKFPTVFEVAHAAGYSTALVSGKVKFKTLARPGTVDWLWLPDTKSDTNLDRPVTDNAIAVLREHQPQLLFVHFPGTDVIGHALGWGSPEQLKEFEAIDGDIARVLSTVDELKLRDHTAILLTADHGGAGREHGPDDARSRHIPWILSGPGIKQNYDLTLLPRLEINTEDTFATACWLLGVRPIKPNIDGKPIREVLDSHELLGADAR